MAIGGVDYQWHDGFFLLMLATGLIFVVFNWKHYHVCTYPWNLWIVVDYTVVFLFRLLMLIDNGIAAGMGLDFGWQQRHARFCGRVVILSILIVLLYPFLCSWTVIGMIWFLHAMNCLPQGQMKWGFLIWLVLSYCGLLYLTYMSVRKWLVRRKEHVLRSHQGIPISEFRVLADLIRVPDWTLEAARQEARSMGQDGAAAYLPGFHLTPAQREVVEAIIQQLPKFRLKVVPTDSNECPICLEELHEDDEVRGLPCAHNFHVECIDQWLRLNVKCPRCRCSVSPLIDFSALSDLHTDSGQTSHATATTVHYTTQPLSHRHGLRLHALFWPVRTSNMVIPNPQDVITTDLEADQSTPNGY